MPIAGGRSRSGAHRLARSMNFAQALRSSAPRLQRNNAKPRTSPRPPPFVVLDLNGTLLFRKKNGSGRAIKRERIVPRPYLYSFLRYCLGPMYDMNQEELQKAWPLESRTTVDLRVAPYGTHFWLRAEDPGKVYEPPQTPVMLMIWSSATDVSVDGMIEEFTSSPIQRALFQRVWSRATLVRTRDLGRKVTTAKDLSIIWDDVNVWKAHIHGHSHVSRPPSVRPRAQAMHRLNAFYRETFADMNDEDVFLAESQYRAANGGADSIYGIVRHTPWGPHNTILLDDSENKARFQPKNHLCIPEFGAREASMFSQAKQSGQGLETVDDYLLQCVGVLDALREEPDTLERLLDQYKTVLSADQPPEMHQYWSARGRAALARHAIPLVP